jgi:RNA polymerase sigma factor (sigma-70 family)
MDTNTPTVHERNAAWKHDWDLLRAQADEAEASEERVTVRRCRREMERIQAEFFKANSGLAYSAARVYLTRAANGNHDDYIQAANIGLLKAWPLWDPKQGTFATFSRRYAEGEENRAVRADEHAHISYGDHTAAPHVRAAEDRLRTELGRTPTDKEVAERAKVSVGIVSRVRMQRPVSLDAPMGSDSDGTRQSTVADKAATIPGGVVVDLGTLSEEEEREVLTALAELPALQVAVAARRYGLDGAPAQTLSEIGESLDSSRETMRRVDEITEKFLIRTLG